MKIGNRIRKGKRCRQWKGKSIARYLENGDGWSKCPGALFVDIL